MALLGMSGGFVEVLEAPCRQGLFLLAGCADVGGFPPPGHSELDPCVCALIIGKGWPSHSWDIVHWSVCCGLSVSAIQVNASSGDIKFSSIRADMILSALQLQALAITFKTFATSARLSSGRGGLFIFGVSFMDESWEWLRVGPGAG